MLKEVEDKRTAARHQFFTQQNDLLLDLEHRAGSLAERLHRGSQRRFEELDRQRSLMEDRNSKQRLK